MYFAKKAFGSYLEVGEKILKVCHKHPVVFIVDFGRILFFGVLIPLFLLYLFPNYYLFFSFWFLISLFRFITLFSNWYFNVLLLTNVGVIDVVWMGFFKNTSSRLEYPMIDSVSVVILGFHKVFLNYGDLKLQGSSGSVLVNVKDIISPKKVESILKKYKEKYVTDQSFKDSESLKNLLTTLIRQHITPEDFRKIKNQ